MPNLDPKFLEILACPKCKGPLELSGDTLRCAADRLAFPVRNDLPILLIEEALPFDAKA